MQFLCLIFLFWVELVVANSDSDALLAFTKGIEKDPLERVKSWNGNSLASDGSPKNWYGIECSGGHVTSITLDDLGLVGSVDLSTLSGLKMLRNLSISNNRLTGGLPPELGTLVSLELLNLSRNSFHGSMPVDLMKLENLVYLDLSSNNFNETVPSGFETLQKLQHLDLHSNGFSGDIGRLLAKLQGVAHVDLSGNLFTGSLNLGLDNSTFIHSVQYLNISHNALAGDIFVDDVVPLFDNLEVFDASHNQLVGQIPSFNLIVSLQILRLGSNQFSGSLPEALLQESSMVLTDLDLSQNQLQGPIRVITSSTLNYLNLSSNKLSGPLPSKVGHCGVVDLSKNMLSGSLSMIQSWGNYVMVIDLSSNSLTGTLPNVTSQFLRLTSIKISNNSLQGPLPQVIWGYPELHVIDLSLNQLNGSLSPSLFLSSRLTELNLSGNSFTGPILLPDSQTVISSSSDIPLPPTRNTSLVSLDLSNNLLNGSLPPEIGTLDQLNLLNVGKNNISGQIPSEIGKLHSLLFLDLSNNHLDGSIPDDLPDGLKGFNVSYNNLSGIVPNNLLKFPDSSFHPGNALLIFPQAPHSPKNIPGITLKGKRHHMKSAIKVALIAGFVGGAALVAILFILIYYRGQRSSPREIRGKDTNHGKSPLPSLFGLQKAVDPSPASLSFSQDRLLSSGSRSMPEHGDISSVGMRLAEPAVPESTLKGGRPSAERSPPKNIGRSSPVSALSIDPSMSDQPSVLEVFSPDRLVGDLHFFDNSFMFTAEELSCAPAEIIGRSCHGTSYRATLDTGRVLTVKWLREGISKGKKEFAREAKKLGNIRHPNIVSLRGYYWGPKEHERLIISDYIDAVCLASHLCETEPRKLPPLSANQRLKIAVDIARCLYYLHNERAIPHGNLKSTNVLLQAPDLNALLTDYSLHRIMNPAGTAEQVLNAGALGYRPPEFASTSKPCPSLKSDVYAFGVIMLEMLTGKSAGEIVSGNTGVVDLTDWVKLLANENRSIECFDLMIPGIDSEEGPPDGLEDMLHVSLRCILPASERPDIRTILEDLSSIVL
ncbi:probable inactive receptor kinase At5g10020 [Magnolia sinica]|uniref:probable inactive receptor kinase At5g10020 n=1 Tax=Magnolia sinica TaxID=86752 RepID=UPI0026586F16|nr:probable inactive receptor kinase At5g10020 [Magnolia sinica]